MVNNKELSTKGRSKESRQQKISINSVPGDAEDAQTYDKGNKVEDHQLVSNGPLTL
jgi:hypothetical protein